ncbi:MAG: glycosyltransferase [Clostridium sp.]|uniref:glycosyltransferase n=1 Tax=Clostridium sp. TaxID=1506 RepID=UPI003991C45B
MKILHYSLGLPPYRSGGLTKYSCDLMEEQVKQGENVFLLFPGIIKIISKNSNIKFYKNYRGIQVYELVNPLPVPLLKGISTPADFYKETNKNFFKEFLDQNKIDIVHIHTFMGLYKEFLDACKELNIKTVYTTHDYFGICTKVNFLDNNGQVCSERKIEKCIECNRCGYSLREIKIFQSAPYRYIKNKGIIPKMKKFLFSIKQSNINNIRTSFKGDSSKEKKVDKNEYEQLMNYYMNMYKSIDKFIFNSSLSKEIYNRYLNANGDVVYITHSDIKDNRIKKSYDKEELRLTYLGPFKEYKGFNLLMDIMKEFEQEGETNIKLTTYGDTAKLEKNIHNVFIKGRYEYEDLKSIFEKTDLLIVPSIWNETFGFIVLEALSHGVPVIVTDKVGSKDLLINEVNKKSGIIISVCKDEIIKNIKQLKNNKDILIEMNKNILNNRFDYDLTSHYISIKKLYNNLK